MEILILILSVLGAILKFILLAVFYIILFVLIVLIIVLITPIKVKARLNINSDSLKIDINNIIGNVYITYLFKIFKVSLIFEEGALNTNVKMFLFNLVNIKGEKTDETYESTDENYETDENGNKVIEINDDESKELDDGVQDLNVINKSIAEESEKVFTDEAENASNAQTAEQLEVDENIAEEDDNKNEKSLKDKIADIIEKIKYVKNYPNKKLMINITLKHIFKILKSFKPKYVRIKGKYGLNDPADTGQILGIISILNSFRYFNIDLQPDFDNECINTEVDLFVSFTLWTIVSNLVVLAVKLLRLHLKGQGLTLVKFIKKLKHKKGDKNGK